MNSPHAEECQPQRWYEDAYGNLVRDGIGVVATFSGEVPQAWCDALADHLNATGWQPPAPEPERPPIDHIIGNERWSELAKHGYHVVDVQGIQQDIDWLCDLNVRVPEAVAQRMHRVLDALNPKED